MGIPINLNLKQLPNIYQNSVHRIFNEYGTIKIQIENQIFDIHWLRYLPKSHEALSDFVLIRNHERKIGVAKIAYDKQYLKEIISYYEDRYSPNYLDLLSKISYHLIIPVVYDDINILWKPYRQNEIFNPNDFYFIPTIHNLKGLINGDGKVLLNFEYTNIFQYTHQRSLTLKKNNLLGIYDYEEQKLIIPCIYKMIICSGEFYICEKADKYGVLDATGQNIIPFNFRNIIYANDLFIGWDNKGIGVINRENNIILPFQYVDIYPIQDGFIVFNGSKAGVFDIKGKEIIPFEYDSIIKINQFLLVSKDGKKGLIDKDNRIIIPVIYDKISPIQGGYFLALESPRSQRYVVYSTSGEILGLIPIYDELVFKYEDLLKLRKNGKLGLFTITGKMIQDFTSDSKLVMNKYWEYIDKLKKSRK